MSEILISLLQTVSAQHEKTCGGHNVVKIFFGETQYSLIKQ